MTTLRSKLIRLAHAHPELRGDLLPLLTKQAMEFPTQDAMDKYLKAHPDADKSNHHVKKQDAGKPSGSPFGASGFASVPVLKDVEREHGNLFKVPDLGKLKNTSDPKVLRKHPGYEKLKELYETPDAANAEYYKLNKRLDAVQDSMHKEGETPQERKQKEKFLHHGMGAMKMLRQVRDDLRATGKSAATQRFAHKPTMSEVTKEAVRLGTAIMMYKIDKGANNSKFYEGAIVPDGTGFRIIRRWGRLTDSGATGRVDGAKFDADPRFRATSLAGAKTVLRKVYETRLEHGYVSAYEDSHVVPATGKKLPMGQYPIGLGGAGFGWGGQSIQKCVPALHVLVQQVDQARDEISSSGQASAVEAALESALSTIQRVSSEDSTMATKLADMITKTLRRVKGGPRFLPDPVGTKLTQELFAIRNYVTKQTSYCA